MSVFWLLLALSSMLITSSVSLKFSDNFRFGVGSAAYQIEGAWNVAGKGENIWDRYTHQYPEKITNRANGDVACDSYNLYKRDIEMLVELGVDFYRFSLSWTRILPTGLIHNVNQDGLRYYNDLINELLSKNITPFITIYHWDLPQKLQELGGWTNPRIVDYFEDYARLVFKTFGDRVQMWTTINEPSLICYEGLGTDNHYAPDWNFPGVADYLCIHYVLLAHARVWHMYRNEFKVKQKGKVGITFVSPWIEPETNSLEDILLSERALQFTLGRYAYPVFSKTGDYPSVFKESVLNKSIEQGFRLSRLPEFTRQELEYVRGTFDFFGLNFYSAVIYSKKIKTNFTIPSQDDDLGFDYYQPDSWNKTAASWFRVYPEGFRKLLNWIRREYDNPEVIITENGYPSKKGIVDVERVRYYNDYLEQLLYAINDGCNVTAYTAWTLMDNFEWPDGYDVLFGLYETDFNHKNRTRRPRMSSFVYREIVKTHQINRSYVPDMGPYLNYSSRNLISRNMFLLVILIKIMHILLLL